MKIYMPIEVASRELEARTLLAFFSARSSFDVVLGRKKELIDHALSAEPGIFLSQWGLHRNFLPLYKKLKRKGHLIVCFDEEGLVTLAFDDYVKTKVHEGCVEIADKVLLWGLSQEEEFKAAFQSSSEKFKAVGNPRDDILDAKFDSLFGVKKRSSRSISGKSILFVSSFGFANHAIGGEAYFENSIKNGVFFNKEVEAIFRGYFNFQERNFAEFVDLVEITAREYPERIITYRCHPAENRDSLLQRFRDMNNVEFSYGGSIIPVLKDAELVIHNYCHAGIEAQILGKQTLAMRYFRDPKIENEQVYENAKSLFSVDAALREISRFIDSSSEERNEIKNTIGRDFLFSDAQQLAVERFVDTFIALRSDQSVHRNVSGFNARRYADQLRRVLRKAKNSYVDQKSEGLDFEAVRRILEEIMKIFPDRRHELNFRKLKPFVFALKNMSFNSDE